MLIIMFQIKDYTNQPLGVTNDQTRNSQWARDGPGTQRGGRKKRPTWQSAVCCPFLGLSTRWSLILIRWWGASESASNGCCTSISLCFPLFSPSLFPPHWCRQCVRAFYYARMWWVYRDEEPALERPYSASESESESQSEKKTSSVTKTRWSWRWRRADKRLGNWEWDFFYGQREILSATSLSQKWWSLWLSDMPPSPPS